MKVMVVGDTHYDAEWMKSVTRIAGRNDVEWILQVGDFGWWPRVMTGGGWPRTEHVSATLNRACELAGVRGWIFIDGNHDDHQALRELQTTETELGPLAQAGECLWYSPRGNVFELAGVRFGTLGGAVSVDAWVESYGFDFGSEPYRSGWDWFPELEAPSEVDLERLFGNAPVDVLLTHEAPAGTDLSKVGLVGLPITVDIQQRTDLVRTHVRDAMVALRAKLLVHGHWHHRYSRTFELTDGPCQVEGLAHNGMNGGRDGRAFILLDLPDLTVIDGRTI